MRVFYYGVVMKEINVGAIALIDIENKKLLLTRRPDGKHYGGFWEFFGGKLEDGEGFKDACVREAEEEVGIIIEKDNLNYLSEVKYTYEDFILNMKLYSCEKWMEEPKGRDGHFVKWVDFDDIKNYKTPPADVSLIKDFLKSYK